MNERTLLSLRLSAIFKIFAYLCVPAELDPALLDRTFALKSRRMSFSRVMLCIFLPPLAVRGKGREAVLVVAALTLFCWLPGMLAAFFMCWRETADPAERRAMALYPELAIEGSPLNREFIRRYKRYARSGTRNLSDPDWAVRLARECKEDIDEAAVSEDFL